jgi:hypothetical protein
MVTTNEGAPSSSDPGSDSGTALSKLRQTLSSSLMTAQDKGKSHLTLSVSKSLVSGVSLPKFGLHLLPVYVSYVGKSGNGGFLPRISGFPSQHRSNSSSFFQVKHSRCISIYNYRDVKCLEYGKSRSKN